MAARRIHIDGVVQGVGFRPFVWSLAQRLARDAGQLLDVVGLLDTQLVGEELRHVLLRLVDGGDDDVRRQLAGQLDDPLAEVGVVRAVEVGVGELDGVADHDHGLEGEGAGAEGGGADRERDVLHVRLECEQRLRCPVAAVGAPHR